MLIYVTHRHVHLLPANRKRVVSYLKKMRAPSVWSACANIFIRWRGASMPYAPHIRMAKQQRATGHDKLHGACLRHGHRLVSAYFVQQIYLAKSGMKPQTQVWRMTHKKTRSSSHKSLRFQRTSTQQPPEPLLSTKTEARRDTTSK